MVFGSQAHLIEKSAGPLEMIHVSSIRFPPPELHIRDLHITPNYLASVICECYHPVKSLTVAPIVVHTLIVRNELHRVVRSEVLWM